MIVPYDPTHLHDLLLQPAQASLGIPQMDPVYAAALGTGGPAYSCVDAYGRVLACAGLLEQWPGRAVGWALLSVAAGRRFVEIHRAVLRTFRLHPYRRIETAVAVGHLEGHRWARLLGFTQEGLMKAYTPQGEDSWLYARVR